VIFKREPLHQRLAREGGLAESPGEDTRAPWHKAGIHGVHRPREWDEVTTFVGELPGKRARFVALRSDDLVIEEGPEDVEPLADVLSLDPPYRAEAVLRGDGVWAVAARRIEVVELPGVDGAELELTQHRDERTLIVDGERRFGSIAALERQGDFAILARRLAGELWEIEASLL
jgi:hypothetical protein